METTAEANICVGIDGSDAELSVAVVIPAYNRAAVIRRAIDSVLNQTLRPKEIIVVDDQSTDETGNILATFYPDVRHIRLETKANAAAARNRGIEAASSRYVAFLDSDDEWKSDHLETTIGVLERNSWLVASASSFIVCNGNAKRKFSFSDQSVTAIGDAILQGKLDVRTSALVVRRDAALEVGFDPLLRKHQDWDFAIRLGSSHTLNTVSAATVLLYVNDTDRMSATLDHDASRDFLVKHQNVLSKRSLARFYLMLAYTTLLVEGRNKRFWSYWLKAASGGLAYRWRDKAKWTLCATPFGRKLLLTLK